jgi:voltage-gated potassium channel
MEKFPFQSLGQRTSKLVQTGLRSQYQQLGNQIIKRPLLVLFSLMLILVAFGTGGYMLIEGWGVLDALYMTTITITTIGYGEVNVLSPQGRAFTIVLIVVGVVMASYTVTSIISLFTSEQFLGEVRNRRRRRMLKEISNHCIICGFGRMGSSLAMELRARGTAVVAVDPEAGAVEQCRKLGLPALQGSASDDRILREAGIDRAGSLVVATRSDAENVFIILTARSLNPGLTIIARGNDEASIPKMQKAGADTVISPYELTGRRVAHLLTHPGVTSFLDGVLDFGDHQMRLEEFVVDAASSLANLSLREARLNVVVLAVNHPAGRVFTHPSADTRLLPGTSIIVMGLDGELSKLGLLLRGQL